MIYWLIWLHALCPITLKEKDAGSLLFFEAFFQSRSILAALGTGSIDFFQILFISVAELEPVLFFINIVIVQAVGAAAEQAGWEGDAAAAGPGTRAVPQAGRWGMFHLNYWFLEPHKGSYCCGNIQISGPGLVPYRVQGLSGSVFRTQFPDLWREKRKKGDKLRLKKKKFIFALKT